MEECAAQHAVCVCVFQSRSKSGLNRPCCARLSSGTVYTPKNRSIYYVMSTTGPRPTVYKHYVCIDVRYRSVKKVKSVSKTGIKKYSAIKEQGSSSACYIQWGRTVSSMLEEGRGSGPGPLSDAKNLDQWLETLKILLTNSIRFYIPKK